MSFNRRRVRKNNGDMHVDIWPGFVDALSTVLLVFIFVLVGFIASQIYLSGLIVDKDTSLSNLQRQIQDLCSLLNEEKDKTQLAQSVNTKLTNEVNELNFLITSLEKKFTDEEIKLEKTEEDKRTLEEKIKNITIQLKEISASLLHEKSKSEHLSKKLETVTKISSYRSEFFDKLKNIVKTKKGVKIVGDRFIFQSELFFDTASDILSEEGEEQIKNLAEIVIDISNKIPDNINWILRVDGHTDTRPIASKFASNWELSAARAISVVKTLIKHGISPKHLVAAGFGEYQPITKSDDEESLAKNRRIEFKLDQK